MRNVNLLILFLLTILQTPLQGDDPPLTLSADEQEVVKLINVERKLARLDELQPHLKLFQSARLHAANMAKQDKLEHELDGKTMVDRLQATGYNLEFIAENIAWNQKTPRKLMISWMASGDHTKNILASDFVHIGVGVAKNARGEQYWVLVLASPRVK